MSRLTICVTICVALCFTFQLAESNSPSTVDLSCLLRHPPYYSALGYSRPASLSDLDYQNLLQISEKYNVKLSDLYQLYDLSYYNFPSYSPDSYINMIQQYAEAIELERMRRGLPCSRYLLRESTTSPLVESMMNTRYSPILQRRNVMDALDNMYDSGSATASNLYKNMYNMVDYSMSKTTQALKNTVNDVIYGEYGLKEDMNRVENFASRVNESLKYIING